MNIIDARSLAIFVGSEERPLQVVRVTVAGGTDDRRGGSVRVEGEQLTTESPVAVPDLEPGARATLELGVSVAPGAEAGTEVQAEAILEAPGSGPVRHPFDFTVAEPGWRMFMVSHFHYDPVWWNTQAAYTEDWPGSSFRSPFQEPGFALVKAHVEMARREDVYKFVLAELDYLKPYWDAYPEDRAYLRQLMDEGRMELMGGTYNEPNTNLTSAETTARSAIYGIGYQRDVMGGEPATAWQLDAFGHDPQFPGLMADAGLSSSSWARGPFHEWGPHWMRGTTRTPAIETHVGEKPRMQFASEFDWVAPSGRALLTSYMANHYGAGWWMDAAATLEEAEDEAYRIFTELAEVATTKNVLLPVGTDYTPPNKWVTAIHRDWNRRYVWPKFECAIPRDFFAAVRAEREATGRGFSPQTRDMNPVYTGKDVSYIDTKQAQRWAENTLMDAEKFATVASLLGARYPAEAFDKAWRQLLFNAHHDGITGSESDQVYLDLLGGWREARELAATALDGALGEIARRIDTSGEGRPIAVFNALSWPRTDVVRFGLELDDPGGSAFELRDDTGAAVPFVVEHVAPPSDGARGSVRLAFLAADVPAVGYRIFRLVPGGSTADTGWRRADGAAIENDRYRVEVDAAAGGSIVRLLDKSTGREVLREGGLGNELLAYREYATHPRFGEGPWHLTPDGRVRSSAEFEAQISVEESTLGRRLRIEGPFEDCTRVQEITLWNGVDRIEYSTRILGYSSQDTLFRVRHAARVEGGASVSEVGNAVVGRGFGFPNVDVGEVPYTLDNPAYNWFGLGSTARVLLREPGGSEPNAARAISIAEIVVPGHGSTYDTATGQLVTALVRSGVTATLSRGDGSRYGTLDLDSNLPDVRVVVGSPSENPYAAAVIEAAGDAYRAELDAQVARQGWARLWVPAAAPLAEAWRPNADLRAPGELPVLLLAGGEPQATVAAVEAAAHDLEDATIEVEQPPELAGTTGQLEDYTVAVLNRGTPGFSVEVDGSLYLSLMRSCTGWPSGVWIDPPRRTTPDGSGFQLEHWSHTFEYALVAREGDWRAAAIVRSGHEYNHPLIGRPLDAHGGQLPASASLASVEPWHAVLTVLKPAGNPLASLAGGDVDPAGGIVARVYESSGRRTEATLRFFRPLRDGFRTNLLEEARTPVEAAGDALQVTLDPYEIATIGGVPEAPRQSRSATSVEIGARAEPAQPVFADYWMHNKGAAPIGYQPVTVQIKAGLIAADGGFDLPMVVASSRTDAPAAGSVQIVPPPGWGVNPESRSYRLAPGAHLSLDVRVTPAEDAAPGRYFVAARIADDAGQEHEDVATVDFRRPKAEEAELDTRSRSLAEAIERATHRTTPADQPGGELQASLQAPEVRVSPGERGKVGVLLNNVAADQVRGEAQIISPHDTWPWLRPWTQGFAVEAGQEASVTFTVEPPASTPPGSYWAVVKVMYFGRRLYTEAVAIEIRHPVEPAVVPEPALEAAPSGIRDAPG